MKKKETEADFLNAHLRTEFLTHMKLNESQKNGANLNFIMC